MTKCIECQSLISNDRHLCDTCFDRKLKEKINGDEALRVDISHPSNEFF